MAAMMFRPLPILTAIAIPLLGTLLWLGVWQVERADWKAGRIAAWEASARAEPAQLEAALCGGGDAIGRIVSAGDVTPKMAGGPVIRMFGHNVDGHAGWRLLSAVTLPACAGSGVMLAETGFEPLPSELELYGQAPPPEKLVVAGWPAGSMLAAPNDPAGNDWHNFDHAALEAAMGGKALSSKWMLEAFGGVPDYLSKTPPSRHIGYAVTWFGMALAFLLIYAAFHARAGRLRFRSRKPE